MLPKLLSTAAAVLAAASLSAQSPITTLFASNNGGAAGGATYFNIDVLDPAGITVYQVDLNCGQAAGSPIGCSIHTAGAAWDAVDPVSGLATYADPSVWTQVAAGTGVAAGTDSPSSVCLSASGGFFLAQGTYAMAVVMDAGTSHRYTNGDGSNQNYATAECTLDLGGGANTPFGASVFQPRVWNGSLFYNSGTTVGNCLPNASTDSFGVGCYTTYSSIYEYQASGTSDLEGYKISGTPNGSGGFDISVAAGSGFAVPLGSQQLVGIGDDVEVDTATVGGTLGMFVGSNGWMATGPGNSTTWAPSVSTMLGNPNTAVYAWTDMQPNATGTGGVYYREFNGVATVVYDNVQGWNSPTDLNKFKIDIDTNTGAWSVEIDTVGPTNPEDLLVGYAVGGASADPGASDFVFGGFATGVPVHELFAPGVNDLAGQQLSGTQDGTGGIVVTRTPGAGFAVPLGSTQILGLGDDDEFDTATIGGTLNMFIGSNGWMSDATGNSTGWSPTVAAFESNPALAIYSWTDLQPNANETAGVGGVYYVENGTVATVIFDKIYGWGTTDENDLKITCDVSNGNWTMEWGQVGAGNPEPCLVGYNNPMAAMGASSTAVDWSEVTSAPSIGPIGAADQLGLALSSNAPALGTNWDLTCSEMEAGAQGAFFFFGTSAVNPGVDLGVLGAPGCFAYTSNDLPASLVLGAGPSVSMSLAIPNNPALAGSELTVQAASTSSQNAFGAATSNGLTGTVGL